MREEIIILDFGSQYTQLIARRIRELNVFCEIYPYNKAPEMTDSIKGLILSGSPCSVHDEVHPEINFSLYRHKIPILGICYGAQLLAQSLGGDVERSGTREYGRAGLSFVDGKSALFKDIEENGQIWMSHADTISHLAEKANIIASTEQVNVAGYQIPREDSFGIQFHPEVSHTTQGLDVFKNFVVGICACSQSWTPGHYVDETVQALKEQLGDDQVVLGLSGGVDSSVASLLLQRAIGDNLHCIFVDNGLLRKNEFESVLESYQHMGLNITGVDAKKSFFQALQGLSEPEEKRKAIGKVFIEVFEKEAKRIENVKWLGQGTIYPDVIESVSVKGPSATIKSHHNVGGLPEKMHLKVVEPLRFLFKDEVRKVGRALKLEPNILGRHPFPGPGLGIRILGDISPEKVALLQEADDIYMEMLKETGQYDKIWQAGAILLPIQSVGVMGDERTYENVVALRAVTSRDGMTADWADIPHEVLARISTRIINEVTGINRVVYDISSKPPATIEWE
jgi:GMP synthase (glutamine-hydrolysing)